VLTKGRSNNKIGPVAFTIMISRRDFSIEREREKKREIRNSAVTPLLFEIEDIIIIER
jgi:hypothetical protein